MTAIFLKSLRDARRMIFWLCLGFGLYALFILSFYPAMLEQSDQMEALIQSYPEEMLSMFYSGDIDEFEFDDPAIFLQTEFLTWVLLIMGTLITNQAFNAITNAERAGTMDLMMSLPISRRTLLGAKIVNTMATLLITLGIITVSLVIFQEFWEELHIPPMDLGLGILGAFFLLMLQASLGYALASWSPSRAHWAGPIALLYFFASYILMGFTNQVAIVKTFRPLYAFNYYNMAVIINEGVDLGDWIILTVASLGLLALAFRGFERKDLAV